MIFARLEIPADADAATGWAAEREFRLRERRYITYRFGVVGAQMRGVTAAFKRLAEVLGGVDPARLS